MNNVRNRSSRFVFNPVTLVALCAAGATSLQAHPGHDMFDLGVKHVVTSPYHMGVMALIGFVLFAGAQLIRQQLPRRVVQILGTMALLASAVLWGVHG